MEILAKKEKIAVHRSYEEIDKKSRNQIISLRINTTLYNTLQNYLLGMHNVSDYTFNSISDILRFIVEKLMISGPINTHKYIQKNDDCIELSIRVTQDHKKYWKTLPNRSKRKIMEKAICVFIENKL